MNTIHHQRPKILIADDHGPNLIALRRVLAGIDADLVEAMNGNDVLAAALDHEFALILLDVQMPDMNGFEAATLLAGDERTRSTPIIFVTASHADDVNRLRGYSFGAVDYIIKPVNEVILLSKVRVFLELYRHRNALRTALHDLSERNRQLECEISERRAAEEKVRHLAHHDGLTGLANRTLFMTRMEAAFARARAQESCFALAYLDIDGFKQINDTHGHHAGDELLKLVAGRLRHGVRYDDTVARLGGDEFAAILDVEDEAAAIARVSVIADSLFQPYSIVSRNDGSRMTLQLLGSLGVAMYPHHGSDSESLIHAADLAMYTAKREKAQVHLLTATGD
jgi:diguanylate cyclase (GGDEF)-like protein